MAPITRSQSSLSSASSSLEVLTQPLRSQTKKAKKTTRFTTKRKSSTSSGVLTRTQRPRANIVKPPVNRPANWSAIISKMTTKQRKMVQAFLKMSNPQYYAFYGSEDWVHMLIEHLKVSSPFVILPSLVRNWMETESVFDKANWFHGYISWRIPKEDDDDDDKDDLTTESDNASLFSKLGEQEQRVAAMPSETSAEVQPNEPVGVDVIPWVDTSSPVGPNQAVFAGSVYELGVLPYESVTEIGHWQPPPEVESSQPTAEVLHELDTEPAQDHVGQLIGELPSSSSMASPPVQEGFLDFESIVRLLSDILPGESMDNINEFLESLCPEDLLG